MFDEFNFLIVFRLKCSLLIKCYLYFSFNDSQRLIAILFTSKEMHICIFKTF